MSASISLSIFTSPKRFEGHVEIIQRNAIFSWTLMRPKPEILLIGDDPGVKEVAQGFGIRHCSGIACNEYGTPLLNDVFDRARIEASHEVLCYVNSDIILPTCMPEIISRLNMKDFLLVGQRWNLDIVDPIDFQDPSWEAKLEELRRTRAQLEAPTGIDYFVFPRESIKNLPPFALGRTAWDNWLIFQARLKKTPVIDATPSLAPVHQNHSYGVPGGATSIWKGPEARRNLELAGGYSSLFDLKDSDLVLHPGGLKRRRWMQKHWRRELHLRKLQYPKFYYVFKIIETIFNPINVWYFIRARSRRLFHQA